MVDLLETFIENREYVQPNHANTLGTVHGGNILKWMDTVGAMSAMRFAGKPCVTAHINQVDFERPLHVGDIALIQAYAYAAGETSVRVRVRASREDPLSGDSEVTTESYWVFVAVDEQQRPTSVPDVTASTTEARELRDEALAEERGDGDGPST